MSKGFTTVLEINGVGYRAEAKPGQINFALGYSHPIVYQLPPGVTAKVERQVTAHAGECRPPVDWHGGGADSRLAAAGAIQGQGHQILKLRRFAAKPGKPRRVPAQVKDSGERQWLWSDRKNVDLRRGRVRRKVRGTDERPRLSVYRSLQHLYAQVISDETGATLVVGLECSVRTCAKASSSKRNVAAAKAIGKAIAERCREKGIEQVVFDRNGFLYHGRVKALAEAAREAGLKF